MVCELGEIVCCSTTLEEAYKLIQNEDFTTIVYGINSSTKDSQEIATLVGLTLVTTRIIVVADPDKVANCRDWQELGVELLADPTDQEVIDRICTSKAIMSA